MTSSVDVQQLRSALTGPVFTPGDSGYDDARRVWNADIDRRPAVIAQCRTAADVAAAVTFATQQGLEIAVRSGAHSVSGQCVVDDGMMINLALMNEVHVDVDNRRARVGGGALLGDLIEAAQEHALATPVGAISHTGVGGLTLGGGMGWLSRKHGLSIDNLTAAEVVLADGRIVRADKEENTDLYWALRGGGGNFGVVTEFEFALHPVDPTVHVTLLFWNLEQGREFWEMVRDVVGSLPPEANVIFGGMNAPPEPFVPQEHQLKPGYAMLVAGFGSIAEHDGVVARVQRAVPPLFEFSTPMPYVGLQQLFDKAQDWGLYSYDKGCYLEDFTPEAIDVLLTHLPRKQSPLSCVLIYRLDGAYCDVGEDDTAFSGGRTPRYNLFLIALSPTPDLLPADRQWVRDFYDALMPHAIDTMYVNTLPAEVDESEVKSAYGASKYDRLVEIKRKYDPDNVFHRNANINPAVVVPGQRQVNLTDSKDPAHATGR